MNQNHYYRRLIPIILYLLINVLFLDKYVLRVTEWHYLVDIVYLQTSSGLIYGLSVWKCQEKISKVLLWVGGLAYSVVLIALQYQIDPLNLQVDRWSAIHNFIDNLFRGIYPYSAQTHLGGYGSPFPVWQILHVPFYAIGNVGLSYFVALAVFLMVVVRSRSARTALWALVLLIASPAVNYEIVVRSDLITNFLCVCALCEWLRSKSIHLADHLYIIALLAGLCASTRLAAVIPLALLYGYAFLQIEWKKKLTFIITTCLTFVLTFLPFFLWDGNQLLFFEYSPFVLQTRQGSPFSFGLFALVAIVWVVYKKEDLQAFHLSAGVLLTCLVLITFGYNMLTSSNYALYSSAYDITYLNMALPFYIYEIAANLNYESTS